MLTLISIQNSSAHQVWPRIPYTHLRSRSLRDQASRSNPIRSPESDDAIPDPDPDPMIGSFDPNHDSTVDNKTFDDLIRHTAIIGGNTMLTLSMSLGVKLRCWYLRQDDENGLSKKSDLLDVVFV